MRAGSDSPLYSMPDTLVYVVEADLDDAIQYADRGANASIAGGRVRDNRGADRAKYPVGDGLCKMAFSLNHLHIHGWHSGRGLRRCGCMGVPQAGRHASAGLTCLVAFLAGTVSNRDWKNRRYFGSLTNRKPRTSRAREATSNTDSAVTSMWAWV